MSCGRFSLKSNLNEIVCRVFVGVFLVWKNQSGQVVFADVCLLCVTPLVQEAGSQLASRTRNIKCNVFELMISLLSLPEAGFLL